MAEPQESTADELADRAVARYQVQQANQAVANVPKRADLDADLEWIRAELRRLRRMIDGASIEAECNEEDATITVTLTWGA